MKMTKLLLLLSVIFLCTPAVFSHDLLEKMSESELFERALIQIELNHNFHKHRRQISKGYGGRGSGFSQSPKYRQWPDLYTNYSAYRDEIIKRASSKTSREYILRSYLNIKDDLRVTVLATAMLDRINDAEKYKRLDAIRKKIVDHARRNHVPPIRNLTGQAHALLSGLYDKKPIRKFGVGEMADYDPSSKKEVKHPAIEFTKNTSIEFLCEMALTNNGAFKAYAIILLSQFKDSKLATKILHDTFGDINEEIRRTALDSIALTGDMETVRKALKDDSIYIRQAAAEFLARKKKVKPVNVPTKGMDGF